MIHSLVGQILRILLWSIVAATISLTLACESTEITETSMFEAAEVDYRQGNYDDALSGYQSFLRRYPSSPLANTAEMRIRTITREVTSMMDRPGSPRPVYHGFGADHSPWVPDTLPDASSEPLLEQANEVLDFSSGED